MPELLDNATIADKLAQLPGWEHTERAIRKTWQLKGFLATMTFANAIAHLAHEANHHPDLSIHDYNQLTVVLTTHSAGGVTDNDIGLASRIEQLRRS
jgi:4a-hydroxytetrahydrobiopterin dehydratase